ncbi:deoxycytidylate deaminase [Desulfitibacter alkalitolerans]|uniref:deoxycytidylate deaminase n=1 Tax=Desulfitibacter alkalitolerans TaxID=264641 RepID=UPI0004829876|nr:deaminase [Desulfitibacter alkalitolerans]
MTTIKRPTWDEYFIEIAQVVAKRSTCLRRFYGSVIVKDRILISTGFNGSARGEANCVDVGQCVREKLKVPKGERYELCVAVHAEQNAIINGDPVKMKNSTIYIAGFNYDGTAASGEPCLMCRRMIKNAMIERVVYLDINGQIMEYNPKQS